MAGIPQSERNALVDRNFGVSPSSNRYVALVTVIGNDSSAGTEVTGAGYAREACTFDAASGGATANADALSWTASGGNYGTVVGVEVYTASTGGTRVYWAPLDTNRTINDTDTLEIAIGAIDYSFDAT